MSLFKDNYLWTKVATQIGDEADAVVKVLMDKYVAQGYSPREICHIIIGAAMVRESEIVMEMRMKDRILEAQAKKAIQNIAKGED